MIKKSLIHKVRLYNEYIATEVLDEIAKYTSIWNDTFFHIRGICAGFGVPFRTTRWGLADCVEIDPQPVKRTDLDRPFPSLTYKEDPDTIPEVVQEHRAVDPEWYWNSSIERRILHNIPVRPNRRTPTIWQFARFPEQYPRECPWEDLEDQLEVEREVESKRAERGEPAPKDYEREYKICFLKGVREDHAEEYRFEFPNYEDSSEEDYWAADLAIRDFSF